MRISTIGHPAPVRFGNGGPSPAPWQEDGFPNAEEHQAFRRWLKERDLNQYGDPQGTMYAGMSPLFYSGKTLYQYASENHPDKPWNPSATPAAPARTVDLKALWEKLKERFPFLNR